MRTNNTVDDNDTDDNDDHTGRLIIHTRNYRNNGGLFHVHCKIRAVLRVKGKTGETYTRASDNCLFINFNIFKF